jgi:septum formation protein
MIKRGKNGDFILASASPRREELLRQIGLSFRTVPSRLRESNHGGMDPRQYALYWAAAKAKDVAQRYPQEWVLAADTIVVIDGKILGKPASTYDAAVMLSRISGRSHIVITALCLIMDQSRVEGKEWVETRVAMRNLSPEDIQGYVATGEPMDKAGAYGIQGIGGCLVKRIEGSYSNVVGLPLCETVELLRHHGVADPLRKSRFGL